MGKFLRLLAVALLVASCGVGGAPPTNLENGCAIARDRPQYLRAMQRSEREWGVPVAVQMATIYHESRFVRNARTPRRYALGIIPAGRQSTAYGYAQAIDSTWSEYQRETRSPAARRDRIDDAADFVGWYMAKSERILGIAKTDARNQYLAYHEGRAGYARGGHNGKSWLLRKADDVARRSETYARQLASCRV
jgi:hypothetical protein